jgi:hypothetical protein
MSQQDLLKAEEIKKIIKETVQITNKRSDRIEKISFYSKINTILMKRQIIES